MKPIYARLTVFFVGLPAIAALILLLPQFNHLVLNLCVVAISVIGTGEMVELFRARGMRLSKAFILPVSAVAPIVTYLHIAEIIPKQVYWALLLLPLYTILLRQLVTRDDETFEPILGKFSSALASIVYPGYLAAFLIRIAELPEATLAYLALLSMVFANDTSAYVFGKLFGRSSRGVSRVSPSKSVPGFVAGPVFSVGIGLIYYSVRPDLFFDSIAVCVVVGVAVGIATVVGDLIESAFKRSAKVKDSGILIPGRGGVLDSVDSVIFAAPIFYLILIGAL